MGHYTESWIAVGDDSRVPVAAFVPSTPLDVEREAFTIAHAAHLGAAHRACGRYEATVADRGGDVSDLMLMIEAICSARIDGITAELPAIMLELETPGDQATPARRIAAHIKQLRTVSRETLDAPGAIVALHQAYVDAMPPNTARGGLRATQVWIGSGSYVEYVPPPPHALASIVGSIEEYLHAEAQGTEDALVRAIVAHASLALALPFNGANGTTSRALVQAVLARDDCDPGALVSLSMPYSQYRESYRGLLDAMGPRNFRNGWKYVDPIRESLRAFSHAAVRATDIGLALWHLWSEGCGLIWAELGARENDAIFEVWREMSHAVGLTAQSAASGAGVTVDAARHSLRRLEALGLVTTMPVGRRTLHMVPDVGHVVEQGMNHPLDSPWPEPDFGHLRARTDAAIEQRRSKDR